MYKTSNTRYFEILSVSPVEARMYIVRPSEYFKPQKKNARNLTQEGEVSCGYYGPDYDDTD